MRKAFNFYRSYFDVFKELSDKDKLAFITALLERQFEGKEPNLSGMANFAYLSQKFNIDSQVAGYETKTKEKLTPTVGGAKGGSVGGSAQEEEKGKEEEKEKQINDFKVSISQYGGTKRGAATELENLKKKHKDWKDILPLIAPAIENQKKYREAKKAKGEFVAEWKNLQTWINQRCWEEVVPTFEEVKKTVYNIPKPNMTGTYD